MSVSTTHDAVVLESASQQFVEATAKPPFLYELTPTEARAVLDDVQAAPIRVSHQWARAGRLCPMVQTLYATPSAHRNSAICRVFLSG